MKLTYLIVHRYSGKLYFALTVIRDIFVCQHRYYNYMKEEITMNQTAEDSGHIVICVRCNYYTYCI